MKMNLSQLDELKLLEKTIKNIEIISCEMVHEKVRFDSNNQPLKKKH